MNPYPENVKLERPFRINDSHGTESALLTKAFPIVALAVKFMFLGRLKRKGKDCKLSRWSQWTECNVTCGYGKKYKTRNIVQMPTGRGKPCRTTFKDKQCYMGPCPGMNIHEYRFMKSD